MNHSRIIIRALSLLLTALMLLALLALPVAAEEAAFTYDFANELVGSAAGTVTYRGGKSGDYKLFWGDAAGEKLPGYTYLGKLKLSGGEGSLTLQPFTAIPRGAATLLLVNGSDKITETLPLPAGKLLPDSFSYSYGVLSDVHFHLKGSGASDYARTSLRQALTYFDGENCRLVTVSGDIGLNGDEIDYVGFGEVAAEFPAITVLACGGNHEVNGTRDKVYGEKGYWRTNMNSGVYDKTLPGVLDIAGNGVDFVYSPEDSDDVFVFVNQMHWDSRAVTGVRLMDEDQVKWLEKTFAAHKDERVNFYFHTYLSDDDHDTAACEGDIKNKVGAGYDYAYNIHAEDEAQLRDLLTKYKNVTFYNGHSHFTFSMQKYNENLNIFDYYGGTATMVHVPSVTAPRTIGDTDTGYNVHTGEQSEGYLVECYDGYQVLHGINLMKGERYGYATYIVYDGDGICKTAEQDGVSYRYDPQLSSLRVDGAGKAVTTAVTTFFPEEAGKISTLYVSAGADSIGENVFLAMPALTKVLLKEGITSIGASAFGASAKALTSLSLPASLKSVGEGAFAGLSEKCDVLFAGSTADFAAVTVADGNPSLTPDRYGSYLIEWKIGDAIATSSVKAGETPICPVTPFKPHDNAEKAWQFVGWQSTKGKLYKVSGNPPAATENTAYEAVFGDEIDRFIKGELGKKVVWELDRASGVLTFSGSGKMGDTGKNADYRKYQNEILTAVVKTGVTSLGKEALAHLPKLKTVVLETGVRNLDKDCMAYCPSLCELYLPNTMKLVAQGTVFSSDRLSTIHFAGAKKDWTAFVKKVTAVYNDNIVGCGDVRLAAPAPTAGSYTVRFENADGTLLYEAKNIGWNQPALFGGTLPAVDGAEFSHWEGCPTSVQSDMTVRAVFRSNAEPEPGETSGDSEASKPTSGGADPTVLILCVAGGVLLVAAVIAVVVILVKKKKKNG